MTSEEKIDLLNTLPVVDFDCDGECCNYVMVKVSDKAREVLNALGCDDEYIDTNTEDNEIDITHIGWGFADWWESDRGFCLKEDGL